MESFNDPFMKKKLVTSLVLSCEPVMDRTDLTTQRKGYNGGLLWSIDATRERFDHGQIIRTYESFDYSSPFPPKVGQEITHEIEVFED